MSRPTVSRLAALLILVAAFAPAAVLGALPLVLLTTVSGAAALTAVVLALPAHTPVSMPGSEDGPAAT